MCKGQILVITRNGQCARRHFSENPVGGLFRGPSGRGLRPLGPSGLVRALRAWGLRPAPSAGLRLVFVVTRVHARFARMARDYLLLIVTAHGAWRPHFAVTLPSAAAAQQHCGVHRDLFFIINSVRAPPASRVPARRTLVRARVAFPSEKQPCGLPFGLLLARKSYFFIKILTI